MTTPVAEDRETSGATTGGLLRYVRSTTGPEAVHALLERSGLPYTAEQLEDQSLWWSYRTRIRLFTAATEICGDPQLMFKVGAAALHSGLTNSMVILLRAMGTPRQVFRQIGSHAAHVGCCFVGDLMHERGHRIGPVRQPTGQQLEQHHAQ